MVDSPKLYKIHPKHDWDYKCDEYDDEHHFWYDFDDDREHRRDMRTIDMMMGGGGTDHPGNYAVLNDGKFEQYTHHEPVNRPRGRKLEDWEKSRRRGTYLGIGKRASRYIPIEETHWGMIDLRLDFVEKQFVHTKPLTVVERRRKHVDLIHIGNFPLLDNARNHFPSYQEWQESLADQKKFLADKIVGKPKETHHCSEIKYAQMGFVGIYVLRPTFDEMQETLQGLRRKMNRKYKNCKPVDGDDYDDCDDDYRNQ